MARGPGIDLATLMQVLASMVHGGCDLSTWAVVGRWVYCVRVFSLLLFFDYCALGLEVGDVERYWLVVVHHRHFQRQVNIYRVLSCQFITHLKR